jgi:hypothetical protein
MRILADFTKLALGVVFAAGLAGSAAAASLLSLPTKPPVLTGAQVGLFADPGLGLLVVTGGLETLDMGSGPAAITGTIDMVGGIDPSGPTISGIDLLIGGVGEGGFDPLQEFLTGLSTQVEVGSDYLAVLFGGLTGQGQPSFGKRALVVISNIVGTPGPGGVVSATGDITVSAVSVIPLPATAPLLLGALGAVALVRRRRAAA